MTQEEIAKGVLDLNTQIGQIVEVITRKQQEITSMERGIEDLVKKRADLRSKCEHKFEPDEDGIPCVHCGKIKLPEIGSVELTITPAE